ncbi:hypothetical protein JAAARDRAFT_176327 [Jaapia argillacea MUCL 33604]|uniref:Protein-L-isoaspartate O-methyltransferase n=1 Tax=Jaapia argillacea MUCL 33604 TaxID=933084 RepID=A0A067PX26_9AGAM|nr:hypothetical protein JAAARDRAFT_176327 [Jaapia argillacea MUCL 33604]
MAWRSSGLTNAELVANLARNGVYNSERVKAAMLKVDRANYVRNREDAYDDCPQLIGHGQTISAPHMHAHAAQHLLTYLQPGCKVLDVGSGSGYLASVFHHLVSDEEGGLRGKVVGIEHIPQLVQWSRDNVRRDGLGKALDNGEIELIEGDGRLGYPEGGPYDAIHVGAAAPKLPKALVDQLASPGRMFIPIGKYSQVVTLVDKDVEGRVTVEDLFGVMYVPLTDRPTGHGK